MGAFDDLIPANKSGTFDDLIPVGAGSTPSRVNQVPGLENTQDPQ